MTLTTPHCPVAESMPGEVELRVGAVPGIGDAEVELVWDPPWDPQKMSDEARLELDAADGPSRQSSPAFYSGSVLPQESGECYEEDDRPTRRAAFATRRRRTPAAEARVAELMARAPEGAIGVKLSTPRRGCSGLAYSVDYVSEAQPFDEKIETPGGDFFIDGASVLYLVGSTMDWLRRRLLFDNPNAKGACGCGESFTV